jgi:phenylacetate-CoA ligase
MNAIDIYAAAVERVPAYRDFLKQKTGTIPVVKTHEDFLALPMIDKADYVMRYHLEDLCMDGTTAGAHLWLRSSGTSRKPFFWPRRYEDEMHFPEGMRRLFHAYVAPEAQPTLIVIGLALGPWGTGMQTSFAFRTLAQQVPGLAVVSPGMQNAGIIEVLQRLSPHYRQTLLLSYPPFAKMALEEAARQGVDLPALNLHLMVGGEGITETYRDRMRALLGAREQEIDRLWCLYGSTDFANVGFENTLTITIRRLLWKHALCREVLEEPDLPMLFQQAPGETHFEVVGGELVVSRLQGIPLVRYRSGDHVRIIERRAMLDRLKALGYDAEALVREAGQEIPAFQTPFVALYGRIDQVVFFYGAKITVEQVKTALDQADMADVYDGLFLVRGVESEAGDPQIEICLKDSSALRSADLDALTEKVACSLERVQSEFRGIRQMIPGKRHLYLKPAAPTAFELGWKTRRMQ